MPVLRSELQWSGLVLVSIQQILYVA